MNVDYDELYNEAIKNKMLYVRVPVYDFDRIDQIRPLHRWHQPRHANCAGLPHLCQGTSRFHALLRFLVHSRNNKP
eukprot:4121510-Pyramimonas_sp.AAC.2